MTIVLEQPAVGGVLDAHWHARSLADLFPAFFETLGTIASGMLPLLDGLQIAINVAAVAQQVATLLPEIPNAAELALNAAINVAIELLIDQIENLRNAGQSLILLPPTPGGYRGTARLIRQALLNFADAQRPDFEPIATVAGWGIIAAADLATIQAIIDAFRKLFAASDRLAAQSGIVLAVPTKFLDPFAANKVAGRAAPIDTPPWMRARIVDLIPGADDAFDRLVGALRSLKSPLPTLPIIDYLEFLNRIIARIRAILELVAAIVALLQALFVDIPVRIIQFDAQFGTTQDIADSLTAWFNPSQPILADVPDNLFTCGVFAVIGSAEPFTVETQIDLLRSLFLPTPSATPPGGP